MKINKKMKKYIGTWCMTLGISYVLLGLFGIMSLVVSIPIYLYFNIKQLRKLN